MDKVAYAQTLLDVAAQVERDEARIKRCLLHAAQRGDSAGVARILTRWLRLPPSQVLQSDDITIDDCAEFANSVHDLNNEKESHQSATSALDRAKDLLSRV